VPRRFILTGAPGAGKTALIRRLEALRYDIVEEAATDVIAREQASGVDRPWERQGFTPAIADLQRSREAAPMRGDLRFSDRSLFCTIALAEWLGHPAAGLVEEAGRLAASGWFEPQVFFVRQLGFIVNTEARRISFADAQRFAELHRAVYLRFGFELVEVPPGSIEARVEAILAAAG
jgi:predicted ATPase